MYFSMVLHDNLLAGA